MTENNRKAIEMIDKCQNLVCSKLYKNMFTRAELSVSLQSLKSFLSTSEEKAIEWPEQPLLSNHAKKFMKDMNMDERNEFLNGDITRDMGELECKIMEFNWSVEDGCTTICPHSTNIDELKPRIGSCHCKELCPHFGGIRQVDKSIYCKYTSNNDKANNSEKGELSIIHTEQTDPDLLYPHDSPASHLYKLNPEKPNPVQYPNYTPNSEKGEEG